MSTSTKITTRREAVAARAALIQSHVPPELHKRIKRHAEAEMISISAYVRRLLQTHVPGG